MSFYEDDELIVTECEAKNYTALDIFSRAPLAAGEKIRVVLSVYFGRSFFYGKLRKFIRQLINLAKDYGINVPPITWERDGRGTFLAMEHLNLLRRRLATAEPGDAYFAHLLLPHNPYVFASDCSLRTPSFWLRRASDNVTEQISNTKETRSRRYEAYLEQVECVMIQLGGIFDALRQSGTFQDALIIVQGDHGSRINIVEPLDKTAERMANSDYLDAFSTLFAVKAPGIEAGYDNSVRSIQELVTSWAATDFTALPDRVAEEAPASVFLKGQGNTWVRPWIRHPLRGFDVP